ncbi:MAG: flagellin [Myxococcales bacterium]|nr:flagellin [Myxococcota bacterium]MDW8280114.1 flagellin [Myxococcales bacterium]
MPLSIYSNVASLDAQLRLNRTQTKIAHGMAQLASGLRIAESYDDPAGLGVSTAFEAQVRSFQQAARNTNDGISMLQTVDGALGQIHSALQRMRELAIQSSNGTLADSDRTNIQTEFAQLQAEIDRISGSTRFGSIQLLNADTMITLQVGSNNTSADSIEVSIQQQDTAALQIDSLKVDTQAEATASIDAIDAAIARISSERATLGAMQNRLRVALDNDHVFAKNLSATISRIRDLDVAQATADLARNQVMAQAGIAVLAQANQTPQMTLALLRL